MESKLYTKYKASELRAELEQVDRSKTKQATKRKNVIKKIMANVTMGNNEMILLFPDVNHLLRADDLETKRMCYQYLVTYAYTKPDYALEVLSLVLQDVKGGSIPLQKVALRALTSINLKDYIHNGLRISKIILTGENENVELRKVAALAVARLYQYSPGNVDLEWLYGCLADSRLASTCLSALSDITEKSQDAELVITKSVAFDMAELLAKLGEWQQVYVLNALVNYVPMSHKEAMYVLDRTVPLLQHVNSSVVMNALKLVMYLSHYVEYWDETLPKSIGSSMASILHKERYETQFLVLRNVILLLLSRPHMAVFNPTEFFCQYDDPIYIKDTKLEILYLLTTDDNLDIVLNELREYATDIDIQMSRKAARAIGNLAVKLSKSSALKSIDALLDLSRFGVSYIIQEIFSVFKNIMRKYPECISQLLELLRYHDKVQEPEAKAGLIWLLAQFSNDIPNASSLISPFLEQFEEEALEVQFSLLIAAAKFYIRHPEMRPITTTVFNKAVLSEHPDLRDRAIMYTRLLTKVAPEHAADIIDGELPLVALNTKLDPTVLEELELNIGTIASIYLKPVHQVFRLSKPKFLHSSPALKTGESQQNRSRATSVSTSSPKKTMKDFDRPAVNVNTRMNSMGNINGSVSNTMNSATKKIGRTGTLLGRKLSIRKPFS